jgi:hypothetical protein
VGVQIAKLDTGDLVAVQAAEKTALIVLIENWKVVLVIRERD